MNKKTIELQQQTYQQLKQLFDEKYPKQLAQDIHRWLSQYQYECTFLYQVWEFYMNKKQLLLVDEQRMITYEQHGEQGNVKKEQSHIQLPIKELVWILSKTIDTLDSLLPLGSVVKLKSELFPNAEQVAVSEFIILQRFIKLKDPKVYIPYCAGLYPMGAGSDGEVIYIVPNLIESVVHVGYRDEKELIYDAGLRVALNIQEQYQSMSFVDTEIKKEVARFIGGEKAYGR